MRSLLLLALLCASGPAHADPIDLAWRPGIESDAEPLDQDKQKAICTRAWRNRVDGAGMTILGGLAVGGAVAATVQAALSRAEGDEVGERSTGGLAAGLFAVGGAAAIAGPITVSIGHQRLAEFGCKDVEFPKRQFEAQR